MARPRSEEKQIAILTAATGLIADQGLGAPTAEIARRAGVPHGSVFTYFESKAALLNALYVSLKAELTDAVLAEMPEGDDTRAQLHHLWTTWTDWGVARPNKRRAMAQLSVSEQITEQSRKAAYKYADPTLDIVRRASANGALRTAPAGYVNTLVETMASATMDYMASDPAQASQLRNAGFEALWNALA